MDKTAIKNYAVKARKDLIEAVKVKAQQLYIFEDSAKTLPPGKENEQLRADGIFLSPTQLNARARLYSELLFDGTPYKSAIYNRVMENVAYTWFNRLIALRFMEVNGYLPSNIRILSSQEPGRIEPDAMREADRLDYVEQRKIEELHADTSINASEKLYKYILIQQCNALSAILPGMFQRIDDYTELLLPDALLAKGGIVYDLVNSIHEDNFSIEKQGQIEIIGWLYQYYISEKKDEVFAALKKNVKITKDTIPAATQLFTPEWIVKYMVENSLGRLWLESNPNAELRTNWKYYVDEAEQEPEVVEQLRVLRSQNPVKRPEDIKLIDPCMGSGHILVYAFDVLYQIYKSVGYSEREIPNLILQHNIHGLDIDDRAGQLAYFALMMKARSYNRRFFRQDNVPQSMVYSTKGDNELEEYGSLLKVEILGDKPELPEIITFDDLDFERKQQAWTVRSLLAQKYDVVVTNPPYMGANGMSGNLIEFVKKHYVDSKSDTSTAVMEQTLNLCKPTGYMAMINIPVWMFLSSFEKLRNKLLRNNTIINMLHFGRGIFGADFGTTSFIYGKAYNEKYIATYKRLFIKQGLVDSVEKKEKWFFEGMGTYLTCAKNFLNIPGSPIAYWAGDNLFNAYLNGTLLGELGRASEGVKTGDNEQFLRVWYEINSALFSFAKANEGYKWYPHHKGGDFRRWYGNLEWVINWENDGKLIKESKNSGLQGSSMYFKEVICWSKITIRGSSFRLLPMNCIFDSGSPAYYTNNNLHYILGLLNSAVCTTILSTTNPTINTQVGDVKAIPLLKSNVNIEKIVNENIACSRAEWDSYETSWDFKLHPLVRFQKFGEEFYPDENVNLISRCFTLWSVETKENFYKLKSNEEELNRIFIDIYSLQDELAPEVDDKDVTIRKADLARDIRSFISYAVGCMFGRYSLDEQGLVFAGGKFDMSRYTMFKPSYDNIIPIGSNDYFDNDIVLRFVEFVRTVYGNGTLGENLTFIADALYPNGSGTAHEKIRRYFLNDFYKDHVKIYQKRPIYWLLDSGKKDGFKALFYLHRYDKYTIARARTDYLHPLQRKYDAEIKRLDMLSDSTDNAREKATYRKEIEILQGKMDECRVYDQIVSHIAHQQIELDLDDGVKVNYEKFQGVEVPKDNGKSETMDLLGRI